MYTLVNRDPDSSVYNFVKELLLRGSSESRKWREAHQDYQRFNLMFGERKSNKVDYAKMGKLKRYQVGIVFLLARGLTILCLT